MKPAEISKALIGFRYERAMTQQHLASFLGCRVEQVNRWEKGHNMPRKKWLEVMRQRGVLHDTTT